MQLNISEIYQDDFGEYNNELMQSSFEEIPENTVPIKVIKKGVHFEDSVSQKPIHQSIPRVNAKMVRPQMPAQKPKISYEDILSKMGMLVSDGKLHLVDRNSITPQKQQEILSTQRQTLNPQYKEEQINTIVPPNSYIYNKYFKDDIPQQNTVRKPRTIQEYKRMLIENYIERERIKQMKSKKLIMPTSNINIAGGSSENLTSLQNKLFGFSKR